MELLLVLAIVAVLAGLAFAGMGPAREAARKRACVGNLRQIAQAVRMYRDDYEGNEPMAGQPMGTAELGLPNLRATHAFFRAYIRNRAVLFCPSFHSAEPGLRAQRNSTYAWHPSTDRYKPAKYWFSNTVMRRGGATPIMSCDEHNAGIDERTAARWVMKQVDVLRLDGSAGFVRVPVNSTPDDW